MTYCINNKIKPGDSRRFRCRDRPGEQYKTVRITQKEISHLERGTEQ
jgi:hypothetical protein